MIELFYFVDVRIGSTIRRSMPVHAYLPIGTSIGLR